MLTPFSLVLPRMEFLVNLLESWICDVRVNLRCRQITMPQHFLNSAEVGPVRQ